MKTSGQQFLSPSVQLNCDRCGGLLVPDFCTDLHNVTGEFDCSTLRCVQCGDVIDPVIQQNRRLQQTNALNQGGLPWIV
jgi:hypothetical protein